MRNAFADEITSLAETDERIVLLSGDIGNRLFNTFRDRWPQRFYNIGVAEANLIGAAAGLAVCGLHPVTYTIAAFAVYRCFEQIRVDLAAQHLPVVVVGTGAGLAYSANGPTHHSCEDLAILRTLPGLTLLNPCDAVELRLALRYALTVSGPVYLRIGKKGEPIVHDSQPPRDITRPIQLRSGERILVLATGVMVAAALEAADQLRADGRAIEVVSLPVIKPFPSDWLHQRAGGFETVVTVEEHGVIGGLGGAVAELVSEWSAPRPRVLRLGTSDLYVHEAGEQAHLRQHYHLDVASIVERLQTAWLEAENTP